MTRERAKEILESVLRTMNSDDEDFYVSSEEFTEAMLLAIDIL